MDGLARTPNPIPQSTPVHIGGPEAMLSLDTIKGIPLELYKHFGVNFSTLDQKTSDKLAYVHDYILADLQDKSLGSIMGKVVSMEYKIGTFYTPESMLDRVYEYTKLRKQIQELEKRQRAVEMGF